MCDEYEALYLSVIIRTGGPGEADFAEQTPEFQRLFIVMMLDMEIQNGGIAQFLWNNGSAYAALVPDALYGTGFGDIAAQYEQFMAEQGITMAEIDAYRTRYPNMNELYDAHPFDAFDDAYMTIWEETNFQKRLLDFAAQQHKAIGNIE